MTAPTGPRLTLSIGMSLALTIALFWPGRFLVAPASATDQQASALYGSLGAGFVNLDDGFGMDVPAGLAVVLSDLRLVASAALLDIGLLEGDKRDPRYVQTRTNFGNLACFDSQTGYFVSQFRCSAGTDAVRSASVDLSYIPVESVWMGGRPGMVFTGLGMRLMNPRTAYGTVGMLFDSRSRLRGGFKFALGQGYFFFGLIFGYDTRLF